MIFNTDTLLFASASGRCAYVIIFILSGLRRRSERFLLHWAASIICSILGLVLTWSAPTYPFMSPLRGAIAFCTFGCSIALCWSGVRLFLNKTFTWRMLFLQSVVPGLAYGAVTALGAGPSAAFVILFAGLSVVIGRTTAELLQAAFAERLPSEFLAAGALGVYFLMFLTSMGWYAVEHAPVAKPSAAFSSLVVDQFFSILIYISFLAMAGERAALQLERLATIDPLTGILNRRGALAVVDKVLLGLARRRRPVSVLLVDVDRFKGVNDQYGHDAGDVVLVEFAKRCQAALRRGSDSVARWGGEEFLIVLPDADLDQAMELAERIRAAIEADVFSAGDMSFRVTVSIGAASLAPGETSVVDVIRQADDALYSAKETGRNRVCCWREQAEFGAGTPAPVSAATASSSGSLVGDEAR